MSQYFFCALGWKLGADSMFVYVGAGPVAFPAAARPFLSSTSRSRLCAACAMFGGRPMPAGVEPPSEATAGVDAPLLACVFIIEASLRDASPRTCLRFLLRRCAGFQCGLRNGLCTE